MAGAVAGGTIGEGGSEALRVIGYEIFGGSKLAGFSFMVFNLLCAPCFAAMGAIRREMNSGRWTAFAIGYMCVFAYAVSFSIYQIGSLLSGKLYWWEPIGAAIALGIIGFAVYLIAKKQHQSEKNTSKDVKQTAKIN